MKMLSVKRAIACVSVTALAVGLFGCAGEKVDYSGVEDGNDYDKAVPDEGTLADRMGIPAGCDETFDVGDSKCTVISCKVDEIDVPDSNSLKKVYYEAYELDSDMVQRMVESVLDKDKGICVRENGIQTKSEIQEIIENLEEEQELTAEDGDDEWQQYLAEQIEEYERELLTAPDSLPAVTEYVEGGSYYGERNGKNYQVSVMEDGGAISVVCWEPVSESGSDRVAEVSGAANSYQSPDVEYDEESIDDECSVTEDAALDDAMDFLEDIGTAGLTAEETEPLFQVWEDSDGNTLKAMKTGYRFTFARQINGIYITDREVGNAANMEQEDGTVSIPTDSIYVDVDNDGVVRAVGKLYVDSTSIEDGEETEFLSYEGVLEAANANFASYYEKYPTQYSSVEFNHLSLVYVPYVDDDGRTCFVPAWEFWQSSEDGTDSNDVVHIAYINAFDGSCIDMVENAKKLGSFNSYTD